MADSQLTRFQLATLVLAGVTSTSVLITCIRLIQEQLRHSYSGFGPLQPMFELPFTIFVAGILAIFIQVIAMLSKRPKFKSSKHALIFGAICGAGAISTVIEHCCNSIVANIPEFQLLVLFLVTLVAIWYRFSLTGTQNARR